MPLTVIEIDPAAARSTAEVRVRFCDTDLMGIVHHANYFAYYESGRVEWLRARGVDYASWASRGMHLPVIEASSRYRIPARFDDLLEVETVLSEVRAASLRFEYRITRAGALLAEGATRLACVDDTNQVRRFTEEMLAVLASPEGGR
jgi:acyl-CoA thioester hydrolase